MTVFIHPTTRGSLTPNGRIMFFFLHGWSQFSQDCGRLGGPWAPLQERDHELSQADILADLAHPGHSSSLPAQNLQPVRCLRACRLCLLNGRESLLGERA